MLNVKGVGLFQEFLAMSYCRLCRDSRTISSDVVSLQACVILIGDLRFLLSQVIKMLAAMDLFLSFAL